MFIRNESYGGVTIYAVGSALLGAKVVFRNVRDSKSVFTRRYARIVIQVLNNRFMLEWKPSNAI